MQIEQVNEADTGIYICESVALFSHAAIKFPKVYYNLRVHAPTDVQLMLGQFAADKSWKVNKIYRILLFLNVLLILILLKFANYRKL